MKRLNMAPLLGLVACILAIAGCGEEKTSVQNEAQVNASSTKTAAPTAVAEPGSIEEVKSAITATMQQSRPNLKINSVVATPITGLYKVSIEGARDIYSSANGQYFISGNDLFEARPDELVNLTELERQVDRAKVIAELDINDTIVFAPEGEVKEVLYVFTDVDCGYCRLLHSKMEEYNAMGVEVRYLGYPRAGIHSPSFQKLATAWCADDKQAALTKLKNQEELPLSVCDDNPVAAQYKMARDIGLTGTPALVLANGELISGYLDPNNMRQRLKL